MPFLLPLLYQLGLGLPSWQSGLLMMPAAAAAMGMKLVASRVLARFGFRKVLVVNTLMIGMTVSLFSLVVANTTLWSIVALSQAQGFFNSLQFTSMNAMAYADIDPKDSSMASTMGSSMQQLSMSFGLACGSLVTAWYLGDVPQSEKLAVTSALHHAFLTLGAVTMISSLSFWTLKPDDGNAVSKGAQVPA
jgi:MFS family permease